MYSIKQRLRDLWFITTYSIKQYLGKLGVINITNTKRVFIDFGPGRNMKGAKEYKARGFYTIALDYHHRDEHDADDCPFDEFIYGDWSEVTGLEADAWRCSSCLEHTHEEDVERAVAGIAKLVKAKTQGRIHIDLTDHRGGFRHYMEPEYLSDRSNPYYLNRLRVDDWYTLIDKYFKFDHCVLNQKHQWNDGGRHPTSIDFDVIGVVGKG